MKKVLIVDDNQINLYMLEVLLKTNEFNVLSAKSGVEALEIVRDVTVDVIVSDILMPDMDGFTLCKEWKSDERLKEIPFIFYTATYTDKKDEIFALSLGADRFLIKPMEPNDLLAVLHEVLEKPAAELEIAIDKAVEEEKSYYKEYSEVLVRKLEEKMLQIQQTNKRLNSLYQASCELVTQKTHGDIINNVLRALVETAGYPEVNYFFYDHRDKTLKLLNAMGYSDATMTEYREKLSFILGEKKGIVGKVAAENTVINIPDTSKDDNWIILDESVKSALFAPVIYEKNLFGVVAVFSPQTKAFDEVDEQNLIALANSIAITFENRMQQEEIQRINMQLEKRIEERTYELAKANRELEAFSQSVTYDLRVPLRAIEGYAKLLEEECDKHLNGESSEMLAIIHANARKMSQIINDLLALSRSKTGKVAEDHVDMTEMAKIVFENILLPEEKESIDLDISPLNSCVGDRKLIQQVWSSLLSKAAFYVLPSKNPRMVISSHQDQGANIYQIKINGEQADRIYAMLQKQNTDNPFGTAELGLAIVKKIIDLHGGLLWIEGNKDDGISFRFSIPLK
jgi:CheY-like chemotaxis protein/signal transduction histidine kinase